MKAIVYDRYGGPDELRVEEVQRPAPKANEILVRIRAVEATKADCELRSFRFSVKWFAWLLRLFVGIRRPRNRILGSYFAGEVVALGGEVTRFSMGDRVFGCGQLRMRAYAEYAVFPESFTIATLPGEIDFAEAASSLLGGLNALHYLDRAKVQPGERILVNGGGGSIGLFAIQIAKSRGAHVTAVDKAEKAEVIRLAGADRFIDYRKTDFRDEDERYDIIFNMVPGASFSASIENLDKGGRYLLGNPRLVDLLQAIFRPLGKGKSASFAFAGETQQDLESLRSLLASNAVKAIVDRVLPFEKAPEAHRLVETEERCGAIVLRP